MALRSGWHIDHMNVGMRVDADRVRLEDARASFAYATLLDYPFLGDERPPET